MEEKYNTRAHSSIMGAINPSIMEMLLPALAGMMPRHMTNSIYSNASHHQYAKRTLDERTIPMRIDRKPVYESRIPYESRTHRPRRLSGKRNR